MKLTWQTIFAVMFKKRLLMSLWFRALEFRTTDAQPNWEYPLLGFVWLVKMCVDGIFQIRTFLIYPKIHNNSGIPNTSWRFYSRTRVCLKNRIAKRLFVRSRWKQLGLILESLRCRSKLTLESSKKPFFSLIFFINLVLSSLICPLNA